MIWFDIKELERKLKDGVLSDKDAFNYLLANLIIYSTLPYTYSNQYETKWLMALEFIIFIAISIVGTKRTFDINFATDNKDYFKRYISISFVTMIRLLPFVFIVTFITQIIFYFVDKNISTHIKDLFDLVFIVIVDLFYNLRLVNSFKRVSTLSHPVDNE